jgi:DNA-binding response OmpR family regulator
MIETGVQMASASPGRILVVEDERKIAEVITAGLEEMGYEVIAARTGEDAFFLLHSAKPDVMVLDLGLPHRGGMEILHQIRRMNIALPVLILTSRSGVEDRVTALDAGADDYLLKPFSIRELGARVRAISRRSQVHPVTVYYLLDLELNVDARTVTRGGKKLELTVREFDLLVYLFQHQGKTVSREMLARDVWQETSRFTPIDNVIDVQMARLRRKLDDPFAQKLLQTVRGVGFILREPEA